MSDEARIKLLHSEWQRCSRNFGPGSPTAQSAFHEYRKALDAADDATRYIPGSATVRLVTARAAVVEAVGPTREDTKMAAYEVCWLCRGSGLQDGMYGPVSCSECHGGCYIIKRDERGRFVADSVPVGPTT